MKSPKSTIRSPEERTRSAGYLLAAFSALVMITCAGAARPGSSPPPAAPSSEQAPPPASAAPGREPASPASAEPPNAPASPSAPLSKLRAALDDLAGGRRTAPVRVLWLGDSHAAADFWPDAVRKPLQSKYGQGGPGFVYVGLGVYRHAGLKVEREGRWHVQPRQPSLWMRQDDGVFGLGGIRVVPAEPKSEIRLTLASETVKTNAAWDLAYRLPSKAARFEAAIEGGEVRTLDAKTSAVGTIEHLTFETKPGATVTLRKASGEPELFGVAVESKEPGVVIDTLGINGARVGTPLAWEEEPWVAEAKRRDASLFVLAYGTNEVGDQVAPHRYGPELESLVARVRKAAPNADCLVVWPTDREGPAWTTLPRVAEVEAALHEAATRAGCEYWSAFQAMGGDGALSRWANQSPPLAGTDRVHLTPKGYAELGGLMTTTVLSPLLPKP